MLGAGFVDRGDPALVLIPRIQLEVRPQALDDIHFELVLGGPMGDKVLRDLLVEVVELHPLVGR